MKTKKWIKISAVLIILAILAGGGVYAYQALEPTTLSAATEQIKTIVSTKGDILIAISADGTSRFSTTNLNFKSSGTISEIMVAAGDKVSAGTALAKLSIDNLQSQVEQAKANYESAVAKLDNLKSGPTRDEIAAKQAAINAAKQAVTIGTEIYNEKMTLYNDGKLSYVEILGEQAKLESAKGQLKAAEYALALLKQVVPQDVTVAEQLVNQTEAALAMALNNLESVTLKAPAAGTVLTVNGKVGENTSTAAQNSGFIVMTDMDTVFLDVQIFEDDISKVEMGQLVDIEFNALVGEEFTGKISGIASLATADSSGIIKYNVTVTMDKVDPRIRSGMTANLELIFQKANDVVTISNEAVKRVDRESVVEVQLADGTFEDRIITTGLTDGTRVEVVSGLNAGETLVIRKVAN